MEKECLSVNKNELVAAVADKAGVEPLTAGSVLTAFQDVVTAPVVGVTSDLPPSDRGDAR